MYPRKGGTMEKLVAYTRKLYPCIKQHCSGTDRTMLGRYLSFLILCFKEQITDHVGG